MNRKLVVHISGAILMLEALLMIPSAVVSLIYRDGDLYALIQGMIAAAVPGALMWFLSRPTQKNLNVKDGFAIVGLGWILLSVFGALPFRFHRMLPTFWDCLFESVSGFTTTGASVVTGFERYPHGLFFWRSFTHWIGGMGVLVLTLALIPKLTGRSGHLVRAESPGPQMSKIVPKMSDMSKILYTLYLGLTVLLFVVLLLCGMNVYDALIHAMGTAGTGGFSNYSASIAAFNSPAIEVAVTVFMILFGVNFALYYRLLSGHPKDLFHSEELKWYLSLFAIFSVVITMIILPDHNGQFGESLRYSAFHVATVLSTTGFGAANFDLWPVAAKTLLFIGMFIGSCAGSTAGGLKIVRVSLLVKQAGREIRCTFQPRKIKTVRYEKKPVSEEMLRQVSLFAIVYLLLVLVGAFLLSLDGKYDLITYISASLTCVSNVGPGFSAVGPAGNFAGFSGFSKIICSFLMLAGRLELYPMFVLFCPGIWRK